MLNFAKDLLLFGYILLFAVRPAKLLLSAYRQNGMGTKKAFLDVDSRNAYLCLFSFGYYSIRACQLLADFV